MKYIFVYGTLRNQYQGHMAKQLSDKAEYVGEGVALGTMYDLGFPGVIEGDTRIKGDLYTSLTPEVLQSLDYYEGHPNHFERRASTIELPNGETVEAWMYYYTLKVNGLKEIKTGDYLSYIKQR